MKMRGRKIAYWVCPALLVILFGGLMSDLLERTQLGELPKQIAAVGGWLFLGAYAAFYKLLPAFGRGGRWRVGWSRIAVGVLLVALGLIARWYFSMGKPPVTEAASMLIALGGYLLAASVEKTPAPEEARADDRHPGK